MSTYEANRYAFPATAITAGTFDNARLSSGSVTQHVDLTALSASNLTSGTIPNARYGTPTFSGANLTSIPVSAPTTGTWTPQVSGGSITSTSGQYQKFGQLVFCQCEFKWVSRIGSTQNLWYLYGLPFTSINISAGSSGNWLLGLGHLSASDADEVNNGYMGIKDNTSQIRIMRKNYTNQRTAHMDNGSVGGFNDDRVRDMSGTDAWNYWSFTYVTAS